MLTDGPTDTMGAPSPPEFPVTLTRVDAEWLKQQIQKDSDATYRLGRSRGITWGLGIAVGMQVVGSVLRAMGVL